MTNEDTVKGAMLMATAFGMSTNTYRPTGSKALPVSPEANKYRKERKKKNKTTRKSRRTNR